MKRISINKKTFFILALALGLILFLIVTWKSNPISIIKTLKTFTFWHFIAVACTFLIQFLFSVISLALIIKRLNHKIALKNIFPLQLARFSIDYITPFSNNGGEPLQIYLLKKKHNVPYSKTITAIILEILLKLSVSLILMAIGVVYFFFAIRLLVLKIAFLTLFSLFLFLVSLFFYCTVKKKGVLTMLGQYFGFNHFKLFQRSKKIIRNIDKCTIYFFHQYPKDFALCFLLAFLTTFCYIVRFYLILLFLGYGARVLDMILVFSLTQVLILVPIPTLLGVHEAGQSLLSLVTPIPIETGIAFVIMLRVISLLMTIPGFILLGHYSLNSLGKKLRDKLFFSLNNKIEK